jgi:membrane protein implicated in regulation of membrane protease activity
MRWAKVVLIAIGALIAFIVLESVFRLLQWAVIALVIGVIIAIAVKAHSQYRLAREHRAQVREEKARRKASRVTEREQRPATEIVAAPEWTPPAVAAPQHDVEADLARLKREMGA